jgi:hypothetical protein
MPLVNPYGSSPTSSKAIPTTIAAATATTPLLAENPARKGATIWNNSNNTLFIDLGATAAATAYTAKLISGGYYELPFGYTGAISGIWDGTNGNCFVRELT